MSVLHGADPGSRGVHRDDPVDPHYVIPAILGLLVVALLVAIAITLSGGGSDHAVAQDPGKPGLPPYWTVHAGESYSVIARKTGLSVDELETFNPYTNPATITPGQRLKLRLHPPLPKPRPKGPKFHTVRTGESFGSIAAKTGKSIIRLQQLNRRIKPETMQPGDRMRLRR